MCEERRNGSREKCPRAAVTQKEEKRKALVPAPRETSKFSAFSGDGSFSPRAFPIRAFQTLDRPHSRIETTTATGQVPTCLSRKLGDEQRPSVKIRRPPTEITAIHHHLQCLVLSRSRVEGPRSSAPEPGDSTSRIQKVVVYLTRDLTTLDAETETVDPQVLFRQSQGHHPLRAASRSLYAGHLQLTTSHQRGFLRACILLLSTVPRLPALPGRHKPERVFRSACWPAMTSWTEDGMQPLLQRSASESPAAAACAPRRAGKFNSSCPTLSTSPTLLAPRPTC